MISVQISLGNTNVCRQNKIGDSGNKCPITTEVEEVNKMKLAHSDNNSKNNMEFSQTMDKICFAAFLFIYVLLFITLILILNNHV